MKLGKIEKKILKALLEPAKDDWRKEESLPFEGNTMRNLAELIYGREGFETHSIAYYGNILRGKAKASLSRALKQLFKKGLVKKGQPISRTGWRKVEEGGGYLSRRLVCINTIDVNDRYGTILVPEYKHIQYGTKVWYMLTEKGKEIANQIKNGG